MAQTPVRKLTVVVTAGEAAVNFEAVHPRDRAEADVVSRVDSRDTKVRKDVLGLSASRKLIT